MHFNYSWNFFKLLLTKTHSTEFTVFWCVWSVCVCFFFVLFVCFFMNGQISWWKSSWRMKVFTGNWWIFSVFWKVLSWAVILVAKSARGDCSSFSLGFLNWLCYCRPVWGAGSQWRRERERGRERVRERERESRLSAVEDSEPSAVTLVPGAESSQLLSQEKVTWLWILLHFSQWTAPPPVPYAAPPPPSPIRFPPPPSLPPPPQRSLSHHCRVFSFPPCFSTPICLAQQGVANFLPSANFPHFSSVGCQRLFSAPRCGSVTPLPATPTITQQQSLPRRSSSPHSLVFHQRGNGSELELVRVIVGPATEAFDMFTIRDFTGYFLCWPLSSKA